MSNIKETECVKHQYSDDKGLAARRNLYAKHGTNKQAFSDWLWEQYDFSDSCRILELGCGNGAQWENVIDGMPCGCSVILSDFSDGMVEIVKEKYAKYQAFSFWQIDIQEIPMLDETFDGVIANHMLYHIPDLPKALSEVRRVLKAGGRFYSSTVGNGGVRSFLHEQLKRINPDTEAFTQQIAFNLQNGFELLGQYFSDVKRLDFKNSLAITETRDLVDWIESSVSLGDISEKEMDGLFDYFENMRKKNGTINIPIETGVFIST